MVLYMDVGFDAHELGVGRGVVAVFATVQPPTRSDVGSLRSMRPFSYFFGLAGC